MIYEFVVIGATMVWIVLGTSKLKLHPVIVLLIATLGLYLLLGLPVRAMPQVLNSGIGQTFEKIGLLILFGTFIGQVLEQSNATLSVARGLLKLLSNKHPLLLMNLLGFLVSIPVFCDAAFVILSSLNKAVASGTKTSTVGLTVSLSTGLYATHVLVPPTPGPLAAAANIHFDQIGLLIVAGGALALVLSLTGWLFSLWVNQQHTVQLPQANGVSLAGDGPSFFRSVLPIVAPLLLMAAGALVTQPSDSGNGYLHWLGMLSNPTIALLVGVVCALGLLRWKLPAINEALKKSLTRAAPILFITAMGGAMGVVLQKVPMADMFSGTNNGVSWPILIPFLLAALLKTAQGSSTVAIITASSVFYPLMPEFGMDNIAGQILTILSVGVGAMTVSHANDSYFWIVSQFGGLDVKTAYKTHTLATLIQGVTGLILLLLAYHICM